MPNQIEYQTDKDLSDTLDDALHLYPQFLPIIDHLKLGICFLVRVDDDGEPQEGTGEPISLKKVPEALRIYMKDGLNFVLVVDKFFWDNATQKERAGTLTRTLMKLDVGVKDDGEVKVKMRRYDFFDFVANIKLNGIYAQNLVAAGEAFAPKLLSVAQSGIDKAAAAAAAAEAEPKVESPAKAVAQPRSGRKLKTLEELEPADANAEPAPEPEVAPAPSPASRGRTARALQAEQTAASEADPEPAPAPATASRGRLSSARRPAPEPVTDQENP